MQYIDFEKDLNKDQLEAVTTSFPHVRVVAGAGSGKTRVLTYRIAFLISEMHVAPWTILAITFTNKVANEMRKRVVDMLPEVEKDLTIKTFHSFAAQFLRREISVIGFPSSFTILDEEDQKKLVQDIAVERGFRKGDKIVGKTISYIGANKLKERYPDDISIIKPAFEDEKECLEIYRRYEEQKDKMLCLDFDDLLLKTNFILERYPMIRERWQNRISNILIDEFQDTNDVEYKLVNFLKKPSTSLYVVGDPDQTIYTWRGANQSIILDLQKPFPDIETIILDRNYRSTTRILDSANKLIAYNKMRFKKDLYTENNQGEAVVVHSSPSSQSEADYVAREIVKLKQVNNYSYRDIAILYRSSYITMEFEHALVARNIPYRIYGGQKFYQRREIKDVLAYFHLVTNPKDDISFLRIINVPRRGIGDTTINVLKEEASAADLSLYEYVRDIDVTQTVAPKKAINALKTMLTLVETAKEDIAKNEEVFSKVLEEMIISLGYQDYLLKDDDDGEERLENVKALFQDIRHYLKANPESTFDEYLQNIALISAQDELVDGDFVTLMTVHTAKGLEYPVIFVVRFNNGVFPHIRSALESGYKGLEEERRLAYVAMTRAKEKLYLTLASDFSYVLGGSLTPSQFIKESGNEIITTGDYSPFRSNKPKYQKSYTFDDGPNLDFTKDEQKRQDFSQLTNDVDDWRVGDIVIHKNLGKGTVIELEGDGIIKVNFENHGIKSIMGNHPYVSKGGHKA